MLFAVANVSCAVVSFELFRKDLPIIAPHLGHDDVSWKYLTSLLLITFLGMASKSLIGSIYAFSVMLFYVFMEMYGHQTVVKNMASDRIVSYSIFFEATFVYLFVAGALVIASSAVFGRLQSRGASDV